MSNSGQNSSVTWNLSREHNHYEIKYYNFWYNLTDNEFFRCTNLKDSVTVELFTENCDNLQYQLKKYFRYIEDLKYYYNPNAKIWNNSQQQILYNYWKTSYTNLHPTHRSDANRVILDLKMDKIKARQILWQ